MKKTLLDEIQCGRRAMQKLKALGFEHSPTIYGVPRGGVCALHYLAASLGREFTSKYRAVTDPMIADIILDDIIDSGATLKAHEKYAVPFVALVDKREPADKELGWVVFCWEREEGPEDAVVRLLQGIGEDPTREGLKDTPKRVVKAWREMTVGYHQDPKEILSRVFTETYDEMVISKDIPFTSLCEHHCLPYVGTADIGYLPNGKVVGLSKLARLVDCFAMRMTIQEGLTRQIADAIAEHLTPRGVAVVIRASHSCLSCRGIKKPGSTMVTSIMTGYFRDKPESRAEFLELCK